MKPNAPHSRSSFPRQTPFLLSGVFLMLVLAVLPYNSAKAASATWNGTTDNLWTNAADWSASPPPGPGDTATFNNGGNGYTTIDLSGGVTNDAIIFDTATAAAYTIGAGGVGSQTWTPSSTNSITMTSTVASNQLFNANLALPATIGFYEILNNSAAGTLTLAGGITGTTAGSKVLTIDGTGTNIITGTVTSGAGTLGLQKTNSGTLILAGSGTSLFAATNVNAYLPGVDYNPIVLRSGTTIISSGTYSNAGELTLGGVIANGGAGNNANLTINGGSLGVSSWLSIGRGNGVGSVSSDIVLNNNASMFSGNLSGGYNGTSTTTTNANSPKGSLTLNNSSTYTVMGNGTINWSESPNSAFTMNLNDSAQFIASGTGQKNLGYNGSGTVTLNGNSKIEFGTGTCYVGHNFGTGAVLVASSACFTNLGEVRVGGSDSSGTGRNAFGTFTSFGTVLISTPGSGGNGGLTIARGNNFQNSCSGTVYVNGGTFTSAGDVVVGYAGTGHGQLAISGATFNAATTANKWLMLPEFDTSTGELDITNGVLNLNSSTPIRYSSGNDTTGINVLNLESGTINFYSDFGTTRGGGVVDMCAGSGGFVGTNIFNLDGGTITVPQVICTHANGTEVFNFNGGTLKAVTPFSPFFNISTGGSPVVNVRNGGAIIDNSGYSISFLSPLVHSTISGDNAIDGGLTVIGSGTVTLANGNSYTGPTTILGGTLGVSPNILSSSTDFVVSNGTVSVDVSSGGSFNANNVSLQNNATVGLSYGNLTANPTFPALNTTTFSAPGTGLTIAVTGLGLRPGTITLVKYTGAALANLNNFSLTLPPGVVATLVNNTGSDSIDLNITTAPNFLTWEGVAGTAWDVNTTANWRDPLNNEIVYQQYTNGSVIVGDAVTFDDTLTNDFVDPQPTNINLTTTLYSFPVVVNSTLPYSFGGAGSLAGTGYILMTNTGTLTVATSNSFSGGTFIDGGTVIISSDSALGAASGAVNFGGGTLQANGNITNTRPISVTAASSVDILTNVTVQLGGISSGAGTLTKLDSGTLVLTGTMSNTPAVADGTMQVAGAGRISSTGVIDVGNTSSGSGVMAISGGTVQANAANGGQFSSSLIAGSFFTSAGSIQMSSGTLTTAQQLGLGAGQGAYAAFTMSGGAVTLGSYLVVGFNNDTAVLNQSGGAITVTTNCPTIAAGGTASLAVANFTGGTLTAIDNTNGNASGRGGMFVGENGTGFLNVSGSASLTLSGDANVTIGRQAGSFGELNLLGGTITTPQVSKGNGTAIFNFNGGTLKAFANSSSFMGGLSSATIYSGGAKINDGGFIVSMSQPLVSPAGFGLSSIPVGSGGSGYIDTPVVTISGGNGSNATATATVSGGVVMAINVTCPGSGYVSGDSVSINITGGGGTGASAGTPTFAANAAGGLTKTGTGTLTLTGANTYSGATTVGAGGQLIVTPVHQVSGAVTVTNGAAFGVLVNSAGAASIGDLNLGTSSPSTNFLAFTLNTGTNPTAPVLQCGTLTLSGTNWVRLNGIISTGVFPVLKYSGAIAGTGTLITNTVLGPQGLVGTVSNDVADSILYVNVTTGSSGLVWQGTNSAAGLTNVWGLNSITNWLLGSTPTTYQQTAPPGDAVTFNDSGSGTVLLSNSVSPANITISNNAVNYTFAGTGNMSGTAGLTKLGTGSATINFTNDAYAGNTVISNGTLQTGSTTTIPSGSAAGNVAIASSGVLDINGLSSTINGLSGAGTVNNSSGTAATLTFGTASTGDTTWAGSFTNSGTGGIAFLKTGTNTVTITGTNFTGGTDPQNQVNGGTMILTNGGSFIMPSGEFWIAQNANTGAVVVAGGSIICSNNWIVVGRNNAAANGTMTVNSGTVQKGGTTGNVVVGSLNATGTLIVNGGQVLNTGDLWLGENASAQGYLYLNGGLVQARVLRPNGTTPIASIAYFNGGTLQATVSTNSFLQVQSMVLSSGLILDDNGFTLSIGAEALLDGDGNGGGLLKKGSGTVYLDAPNTYTGTTAVSNGMLAGIGTISGPVLVNSGGTVGAGDVAAVGTLSLSSTPLTIQGSAMLRINKTGGTPTSDLITGISTANYGGTLVISNITSDATPLANGDTFTLFSASASSGNFANIIGSPGPGLAYSFNPANGVLSVVTGVVQPPAPTINKITFSGGNIIITATNNNGPGGTWALLGTNNLASPLTNWPVITNGNFDTNGNLVLTNAVGGNRGFFILRAP